VLKIAESCELERGLVAGVALSADVFVARGAELLELAPIVHVSLSGVRPVLAQLAGSPALAGVRALSLRGQGLTTEDAETLAACDKLTRLWWLDLSANDIELDGVRALAVSPYLSALEHVELSGNPGNVHERAGTDGYQISGVWFPPEGRDLEEELGPIRWLHYHPATWASFPPDPCGPPPS
jgi:hypothetical protein